jgi:hypothetical protein
MNYEKNYYDYAEYIRTLVKKGERPASKAALEALRRVGNKVYYEFHHVIPKSLGGDDSQLNVIPLTSREHFLAHYLLCKIYDEKISQQIESYQKMLFAFTAMSMNMTGERYKNSKLFASQRAKSNQALSSYIKSLKQERKGEVYCLELNKKFESLLSATRYFNPNARHYSQHILEQIEGKRRIAYGYHWSFEPFTQSRIDEIKNEPTRKTYTNSTKIRCIETGEVFNSSAAAERSVGLKGNGLVMRAVKMGTLSAGMHWEAV